MCSVYKLLASSQHPSRAWARSDTRWTEAKHTLKPFGASCTVQSLEQIWNAVELSKPSF